jgi:hypothetical protein
LGTGIEACCTARSGIVCCARPGTVVIACVTLRLAGLGLAVRFRRSQR